MSLNNAFPILSLTVSRTGLIVPGKADVSSGFRIYISGLVNATNALCVLILGSRGLSESRRRGEY